MEIKEHKLRFEVGDRFEYECVPNDFTLFIKWEYTMRAILRQSLEDEYKD